MNIKNGLIFGVLLATLGAASAANAEPIRVRGAVVSLEGQKLVVHARDGKDVAIMLGDKFNTVGVVKASLADIKPGVFIGTASAPQPDGSLKGLEVLLFPEALRGAGEGHYPWDLQPKSMMTNATVSSAVKAVDGATLTLAYKGGEQKVTVGDNVPATRRPTAKSRRRPWLSARTASRRRCELAAAAGVQQG
jgi:hypothetical protein